MQRRKRIRAWLRRAAERAGGAIVAFCSAVFEPGIQAEEARLRHPRVKRGM